MNATEGADPFGTARLRRGVLDAWGAGPARFREDANAEEDLALGGYRDRLVVELAQNAADAAARAQVPGRLRLTLHPATPDNPAVLAAANTGAPLDATGVESLSTLRASAKREGHEGAVGRFGVGFAAVLAVSDEPAVVGRHGGVRWSLAEARDLAARAAVASPGLGDELRRRDGHVPLLRLPLPAEGTAPDGYDTVVVLPLRDGGAEDLVARLLDAVDDALLLTLRGLEEIVIETPDTVRTLRRSQHGPYTHVEDSAHGTNRWRTVAHHGPVEPALLADRPREERLRPHWSVTWAVPVDAEGAPVRPRTLPVVHAPTPTDEPLGIPALLIASLPLDTARRHFAPGPLTEFLVQRAADAYAELLAGFGSRCPSTPSTSYRDRSARANWTVRCAARSWSGCRASRSWPPPPRATPPPRRTAGTPGTRSRTAFPPRPPPRCGPSRPRCWKGSAPRPYGCSPRSCRVCCPPDWNAAASCVRSRSPGSR